MIDPTLDLRKGSYDAIKTAMAAAGYTARCYADPDENTELPYVFIGDFTVTRRHNKTHDGTDSTATFVAWAKTVDDALTLANIVLQALTDRSSPISVASTTKLITYDLDQYGPLIVDDTPENDSGRAFGIPIRLRYRTHE